ncbi:MAG TPA: ATP-binding protein [Kofleriaceae bacterium]|nr:ATP-binding protein [Kofleriaceae bacterium]
MSDRIDLHEFIGGFVVEAEELITSANASLLALEEAAVEGRPHLRAVRDLFRAMHTVKGLAGMVGVEPIVDLAHALETIIRSADRAGGRLEQPAIDVMLQGVRAIAERVRSVADGQTAAPAPPTLLEAIAASDANAPTAVTPPPSIAPEWDVRLTPGERQELAHSLQVGTPVWTLPFRPSDARAERGINIATVRARVQELGDIVKVVPRTLVEDGKQAGIAFELLVVSDAAPDVLASAVDGDVAALGRVTPGEPASAPEALLEPEAMAPSKGQTGIGRAVVRVELDRLDALQDQMSLLTVSRFRLERELAALAAAGLDVRRLREVADLQARQLRDLRRAILRVRLVRVADVLEPLALLVRSTARAAHKDARIVIETRDTELDKAVADRLLPAMIHLVRNAIDHAIEPPEARVDAGKPRTGTIRVTASDVAGKRLELSISDDGRGIDRAAIAHRAGRSISGDVELLDVLSTPGFSTRDAASRTSGRGVGMEIVRRIAVTDLGGELAVTSELGAGTTFTLTVPLTIAVVDVFAFVCGPQAFVVPVAAVEEIVELAATERIAPPGGATGASRVTMVQRRGRALPLVALGPLLAIDAGEHAAKAIVTRRNGELLGFAVDRMLGRHEVVVRPIDDPLVRVRGIAGATDLGDGRPTLVLDLSEVGVLAGEGGN